MAPACSGFFDGLLKREVRGWAILDGETSEPARVDVLVDGVLEAELTADRFRSDLLDYRLKNGFCAFAFEVPDRFCDGRTHMIDVRHAGSDRSLDGSPKPFVMLDGVEDRRDWCRRAVVFEDTTGHGFGESLAGRRKLAIFATYHLLPRHLAYHRRLIEGLTAAGFTTLVVHAADEHASSLARLDLPHTFVLLKRNIGYDFGSYATGLLRASEWMGLIDEVVLLNDSVLPIVPDLTPVIRRLRASGADAAGCTDSYERRYHLQSYLLWFSTAVCRSGCLERFVADYSFTSVKDEVIEEGEVGLSQALLVKGFKLAALHDYTDVAAVWLGAFAQNVQRIRDLPGTLEPLSGRSFKTLALERLDQIAGSVLAGTPTNPTHFFWDTLIEAFDFPFLKRELVITNPCHVPTYFRIAEVLAGRGDAVEALMEMRRAFGGELIPTLAPTAAAELMRPAWQRAQAAHGVAPSGETSATRRAPARFAESAVASG